MFERGWMLRWKSSDKADGALLRSADYCAWAFFAEGRNAIEISLLPIPKRVFNLQTIAR